MPFLDPQGSQNWLSQQLSASGLKTVAKLAEVSGIHKGTLSKYFRQIQRPTIDVLVVLSQALQVTPSELLYGLGAIDEPLGPKRGPK